MKIHIAPPEVNGDTVRFRWDQSGPNPFQAENGFFFRYEDLDLDQFSPDLWTEIFLGLQLKVFAAYDEPIELEFARPVPRPTAEYWLAFHRAGNVTISPIAEVASYDPWVAAPGPRDDRPRFSRAVFFGGGKDSMLAASLLAEIHGVDRVLLVQFVHPMLPGEGRAQRLERRMDELILQPARDALGFATRRVWTDYQAHFLPAGNLARPHVELFTVGALPALLAAGVTMCVFSYSLTAYFTRRLADGTVHFHYASSRPEVLATQTAHYNAALGVDLTVADVIFPLNAFQTFTMLRQRYDAAFRAIIMCMRAGVGERWCYGCTKCGYYAILSLACGWVDPHFDYEHFFSRSAFINRIVDYAESGVELTDLGIAPWRKFVSSSMQFFPFCHAASQISLDLAASILSPDAFGHFLLLKSLFGGRAFPAVEVIPRQAFDLGRHEDAGQIALLAAQHFPIVTGVPMPRQVGNEPVQYLISPVYPAPTATVPHIQAFLKAARTMAVSGTDGGN
ncbi:MAG TPA: hypothetical protein VFL82_09695 [Thermomicrobiales bacterium]|nr:hypothetical protein [Thermomicrobiales bacterium]